MPARARTSLQSDKDISLLTELKLAVVGRIASHPATVRTADLLLRALLFALDLISRIIRVTSEILGIGDRRRATADDDQTEKQHSHRPCSQSMTDTQARFTRSPDKDPQRKSIDIVKRFLSDPPMTGNLTSYLLQFAVLLLGIALLIVNRYWNKGPAVDASGIFFINIFWITMVLGHDLPIWSALRNTVAGGLILLSILAINLIAVAVLAFFY